MLPSNMKVLGLNSGLGSFFVELALFSQCMAAFRCDGVCMVGCLSAGSLCCPVMDCLEIDTWPLLTKAQFVNGKHHTCTLTLKHVHDTFYSTLHF